MCKISIYGCAMFKKLVCQWVKALFSSTNRLCALSDAILLLAGRRHVLHKNAYRLNAHGSTCTLVAGTQDIA